MFLTFVLIVLVLTAAVTDSVSRRIYNWTTYPGILAGLLIAVGGALLQRFAPAIADQWQPLVGWLPLSDALAGFFACGLLMLVCFVFLPTGGGDVKLLAMVGALAGLEKGLEVLLWTFVFGGCLGLTILIWRVGPLTLLKRASQLLLGVLTLGTVLRPPPQEQKELQLPVFLGPCAAVALAAALLPLPLQH